MTNGCGGCGGCNDCRQSIQINQIATCGSVFGQLCTDSEVYLKSSGCNTSCCSLGVDICRLVSNNKIVSPDGTILIDTEPTYTSINGQLVQTDCKMTLEGNDTFYVNGNKVFCRDSDVPSERNWCIIGEGVNISFVSQADECLPCGTGCKAMKLSVTEASVAKELRVGYTTESVNQLDIIRNPTGSINTRFDPLFEVTPTNLVVPVGSYDTYDVRLKRTPIATINGIAPDTNQNYNLCDVAPIRITSSATECGVNSPGSKVQLDYNTDQFTVNGSDELELACNFLPNIAEFTDKKDFCGAMLLIQNYMRGNNLQIGGQATTIALDVDSSTDADPGSNYADSSGNTMNVFIPKVTFVSSMSDANVLNINNALTPVPVAPAGFQYYAEIKFHANLLTDTPSADMPDDSRINFTIIPEINGDVQFGSGSDYQDGISIVFPAGAKSALRADINTSIYVPLSAGTHIIKLVLWTEVLTNAGLALIDYPTFRFGELKYRGSLILVPLSGNRLT